MGATRSFSFRLWLMVFVVLAAAALMLRHYYVTQMRAVALEELRTIVVSQAELLSKARGEYGGSYLRELVARAPGERYDPRLVLVYRDAAGVVGASRWPAVAPGQWRVVTLPEQAEPLLGTVHTFASGDRLFIGYSMARLRQLDAEWRQSLWRDMLASGMFALLVSALVVALQSRALRPFNQAFVRIRSGDLEGRVQSFGSKDQFDRLADNLNRTLDWIASLLITVRETTNSLAHDLRTPLSRHRLRLAQLAARPDLPAEARHEVEAAVGEVDGLVGLFEQLLLIARAESGVVGEHFRVFDLVEVVADLLDVYEPLWQERGQVMTAVLPEQPLRVRGDRQWLLQALSNLFDNAIKYGQEQGALSLRLVRIQHQLLLTLANDAEPLPAEALNRVFDRFYRVDASRHTPGWGLGLALARAVLRWHDGELTLLNTASGVEACVRLPEAEPKG